MAEFINIVFDGPPGPSTTGFVEVELPDGTGVKVGEWVRYGEEEKGWWALRIKAGDIAAAGTQDNISARGLVAAAGHLNTASNAFGEAIRDVESALKSLNLGIEWWVPFTVDEVKYELGYAKVKGKWCLAIGFDETEDAFSNAPRHIRLEAFGLLPQLLEGLRAEAERMTHDLEAETAMLREVKLP